MSTKNAQNEVGELPYMVMEGGVIWAFFPEEFPQNQWVMLGVSPVVKVERAKRLELSTSSLARKCSTN